VAGAIVNTDIIGSLEYSSKVAGAKAIVVLGHNFCGAIKSAVDDVKLGNITALLKNFQPALATLTKADGHRDSHNDPLVQKVAEASARLTAASLTRRSPIIKQLVDARQLKIAAAMHDITTGKAGDIGDPDRVRDGGRSDWQWHRGESGATGRKHHRSVKSGPDTASKKLGLLRELVPGLHRLAILADAGNPCAALDVGKIGKRHASTASNSPRSKSGRPKISIPPSRR